MSVVEWSMVYNAVFIIILAVVCFIFSRIHLKIAGSFTKARWLFASIYFIAIAFVTIFIWHTTIGFIV